MDMMSTSASQDVKAMLADAIAAMQSASATGHEATARIAEQASNPALKELLQNGSKHAQTWQERLSEAAAQVGGAASTASGNPIIDAIQQVGGKIMNKASDPAAHDLGIIASGQLAVHYYIAAFGTMAAYAKMLGLSDVAQSLHQCLDEAKQGDARYTEVAGQIAG